MATMYFCEACERMGMTYAELQAHECVDPTKKYDDLLLDFQEAVLQILLLRTQMDSAKWKECAQEAANAMKTMRLTTD